MPVFRGGPHTIADGRLTLETGEPVSNTDQADKATLFYTPYVGDQIALYDGQDWIVHQFSELSYDLTGLAASRPYDFFVEVSGTSLALFALAWTDDTTRNLAISRQDGVWVRDASKGRRYVGSAYIDATGGETNDTLALRHVWNLNHRVLRPMRVVEATNSWTYTTATFRQANAAAGNQLDVMVGLDEDPVRASVVVSTQGSTSVTRSVGIGLDSTTALASGSVAGAKRGSLRGAISAQFNGQVGLGRHFLAWIEQSEATGTVTWYGDDGGSVLQSGIVGGVFA